MTDPANKPTPSRTPTFDALPGRERNAIDHWITKTEQQQQAEKHSYPRQPIDVDNPDVRGNLRENHAKDFKDPAKTGAKETITKEYDQHLGALAEQAKKALPPPPSSLHGLEGAPPPPPPEKQIQK